MLHTVSTLQYTWLQRKTHKSFYKMKYMYIKKDTKSCKQTGGPGFEVNFLKPHLMHFICLNLAFIERIWLFFFHWKERGSPKDHFTSLVSISQVILDENFFFQCLLINFLFLVMMAISVGSRDCSDKILIGRWPSHST
jgi:hypothetical protein